MSSRDHQRTDLGALSPWAPELARTFVSLASDIALVIDDEGVILSVAQKSADSASTPSSSPSTSDWVGQQWIDTVTGDTRAKIQKLLQEVTATGSARRREVGHPVFEGDAVPIAYTAVRLGADGPVLAVGRDLRAIAAIQQRFIETQQDLERDYWRARQDEARYRLLFQVATDGVMVVDAKSLEVVEANQAASLLFSGTGGQLVGKHVTAGFDHYSRGAVTELMERARSSGDSAEIRARLLGTTLGSSVAATPFRVDSAQRLLVRVRGPDSRVQPGDVSADLAKLVDDIRDGVVITDSGGHVVMANPAFLRLFHIGDEASAKGRLLTDWMRATSSPMATLIATVRREGIARGIGFEVHGAGSDSQFRTMEVAASLLTDDEQERIGFTIRRVAPEGLGLAEPARQDLLVDLGILSQQLGVLPMSALMAEASAIVERRLIGMALERTGGDTAAAALLLGISRERLGDFARQAGTP